MKAPQMPRDMYVHGAILGSWRLVMDFEQKWPLMLVQSAQIAIELDSLEVSANPEIARVFPVLAWA